MKELKEKLLKYLGLEDSIEHYESYGYLTTNAGVDDNVYHWFYSNGYNACINAETGEIIDNEDEINKLFGIVEE